MGIDVLADVNLRSRLAAQLPLRAPHNDQGTHRSTFWSFGAVAPDLIQEWVSMSINDVLLLPEPHPGYRQLPSGRVVRESMLISTAAPDVNALTSATRGVTEENKA